MNSYLLYLVDVNVVFSVLVLSYHLLFKQLSFYQFNRFILMLCIPVSVVVPLLSFPSISLAAGFEYTLPLVFVELSADNSIGLLPYVTLFVYWSVFAAFIISFVKNLWLISRFIRKQGENRKGNIYILNSNTSVPSFSFFNRIHINEMGANEYKACLQHEIIHVKQHHSVDNIIYTLFCYLSWFNPLVWNARRLIKLTHEYEADKIVSEGIDKKAYLDILLQQQKTPTANSLVHRYNHYSSLKSRIIMLTRKPSNLVNKWRYLLFIPAIATGIVLNSCKTNDDKNMVISENNSSDEVLSVADKMPEFPGGHEALYQFMAENIKYPEKAKSSGVEGTVHVSFVVLSSGELSEIEVVKTEHASLDPAALQTIEKMPNWQPGEHEGKLVNVKCILPIKFVLK